MEFKEAVSKQQEFTRLLIKTPLEKYTSKLWEAFLAVACDALDFSNLHEEFEKERIAFEKKAKSVSQQYLAILKGEPVKIGNIKVTSNKVLEAIKQALFEEYQAMGLNLRPMTYEEAEAKLEDWRDDFDTECIILNQLIKESGAMPDDEDLDAFHTDHSNVEWFIDFSDRCIFELPAHPLQVEKTTNENPAKSKRGRKLENKHLIWLVLEIRKYYKTQNNDVYRLIFDCMDLFGLLDDVKEGWEKIYDTERKMKTQKAQYIKNSIYKPALKYETPQPTIQAKVKGIGMEFHDTL